MEKSDLAESYLTSLEKEIRVLCPQSEVFFQLIYTLKKEVCNHALLEDTESFLEQVNQFEDILDAEMFWNDAN